MTKYTKSEKLNIGKETFYRLLETEYGENVREDISKKYGLSASQLSTYLSMFKNNIVEPKPTEEEIQILNNYYQRRMTKNYNRENITIKKDYKLVKELLSSLNDQELKLILDRYDYHYIKKQIEEYLLVKPLDRERLTIILNKLSDMRTNSKNSIREEKINSLNNEKKEYIKTVLNEFLNCNDIYPNYVFNKYNLTMVKFNSWIKLSELPENEDLRRLLNSYYKELKYRELAFVKMIKDLVANNSLDNLNILDFYRMFHMSMNKFKFFVRVAKNRELINNESATMIDNYLFKHTIGSYQYKDLNELKNNLNYNYNGVELTSEYIDEIVRELSIENIPITVSTIIALFQEKNNYKVNKR